MSIWKKAISVATSAALLASLLTAVAAPAAFAGTTITSAGSVPRAGTSAGTATFVFTENTATALAATGTFTVTILDSAAGATVTFDGTPVVSAPGSLGATASVAGNVLSVKITGFDNLNVETITVSGLKIKATAAAALGAIQANFGGDAIWNAFVGGTATATGKLAQAYGPTTTVWIVAVDATSPCIFSGTNAVTVGSETLAVTSVSAAGVPVAGQQTFTTAAMGSNHLANEIVTQTVPNCTPAVLPSPGTVVDTAIYNAPDIGLVFAGEFNQPVPLLSITERTAGYFSVGTTITFTIATDGVTFSNAPSVSANNGLVVSGGALAVGRKSVSYTVTTASGSPATLTVSNIRYDVAASVPMGTYISVGVALSGGKLTVPTSRDNAVVNRIFTAVAGSVPNVFIGQNGQATGLLTLTEVGAGSFTDGLGSFNTFAVCADSEFETFTSPGPWAKVVSGDLKLREGATVSPDNIVQGIQGHGEGGNCYYWTVWTASTTASVIQIGNADFTSGPLVSVSPNVVPGPVFMGLYVGSVDEHSWVEQVRVQNATRVYQGAVTVTALSQPLIQAGLTGVGGDIQIKETVAGSLKAGDWICLAIQPRASNNWIQDTWFDPRSQDLNPIASATGGGMVVGTVFVGNFFGSPCSGQGVGDTRATAGFRVVQQATGGVLGTITIKNFHYTTTADAPAGPVSLRVSGWGGNERQNSGQFFSSFVSNARIGAKAKLSIGAVSALGLNPTSGYTTKTPKVQAAGKYITWKFTGGTALAGQRVNVLVAQRINGAWGGPQYLKSAFADANGIVTFSWKAPAGTVLNVRVQWPGNVNYAVSTSKALGAHWK